MPVNTADRLILQSFESLQDEWGSYKLGDSLYYVGLYWDCCTPHIDLSKPYTICGLDGDKVVIELNGVKHTVYRCELSRSRRPF